MDKMSPRPMAALMTILSFIDAALPSACVVDRLMTFTDLKELCSIHGMEKASVADIFRFMPALQHVLYSRQMLQKEATCAPSTRKLCPAVWDISARRVNLEQLI